jgi:hypothetical protein
MSSETRKPLTLGELGESGLSWGDLHPADRWAMLALLSALAAVLVHTVVLRFGPPAGLEHYVIILQVGPYLSAAGVLLHLCLNVAGGESA